MVHIHGMLLHNDRMHQYNEIKTILYASLRYRSTNVSVNKTDKYDKYNKDNNHIAGVISTDQGYDNDGKEEKEAIKAKEARENDNGNVIIDNVATDRSISMLKDISAVSSDFNDLLDEVLDEVVDVHLIRNTSFPI